MGDLVGAFPLIFYFRNPPCRTSGFYFSVFKTEFSSRIAGSKWGIFLFFKKAQYSFASPFSNNLRKKELNDLMIESLWAFVLA